MNRQWVLGEARVSPYAEWMMLRLLFELDGAHRFFQAAERVRNRAGRCLRRMNGVEEEETAVSCWSSDAVARALGLPEELAFAPQGGAVARTLLAARWQAVRDTPPVLPTIPPEMADEEASVNPHEPRFWAAACANLRLLEEALALDAVKMAVLRLVLHLAVERPLRRAGQLVGADNFAAAMVQVAQLLDVPRKALRRAVGKRGKLRRYGLLACRDELRREFCDWKMRCNGAICSRRTILSWKNRRARSCCVPACCRWMRPRSPGTISPTSARCATRCCIICATPSPGGGAG